MKCFFCKKKNAVVRVKNNVGAEFDVCQEHAGVALNAGYKFVSAQHSVYLTAFGVVLRKKLASVVSKIQSLLARIGGR